ncbi:MAG TPA: GLPGLI family protein [Flavobacteriaceae bacterium]|nr:GLPGLI family protein [Flavobacteriaceae bacterium]
MRTLFLLLTLIFSQHIIYAQIQSGEIIYKIKKLKGFEEPSHSKPENQAEQMAQAQLSQIRKQTKQALPYLEFKLEFNKNEALFKHRKSMDTDAGGNIDYAISFMSGKGVFYTNIEEDIVLNQKGFFNKLLLIESEISEIDWELKDEFQTIAGYECQKAITTINISPKHPDVDIPVWFAKELPFSFGPIGKSGLPGLILGLERNGYMYYPEEINLSEKELKINPPKKGKRLTEEELRVYAKEISKNPLEAAKILEGEEK